MGKRECIGGLWSACRGDRVVELDHPGSQRRLTSLPTPAPCADNPCDPYCQVFEDAPEAVELEDGANVELGDDGLQLVAVPPSSVDSSLACQSIEVVPSPQTFVVKSFAGSGGRAEGGPGLRAEYFTGFSSSGLSSSATPTTTQVDPQIDFSWGNGSPTTGIPSDHFSVRWTGYVVPTVSGSHRFYPTADDGVRLWLDGVLLVDAWRDQGPTEYTSSAVSLQAGIAYPIRMEYYENGGGATAILRWQGPSSGNSKVPIAPEFFQLAPPVSTCNPSTVEAEDMYHSTGGAMTDGWNIWSNGYISTDYNFGAGPQTITVRAQSTPAAGQWARMRVSIAGNEVFNTFVTSSSWTDYTFTYQAPSGTQEVRIAFDNDYYQNGEDRNLHVDKLTVACTPVVDGGGDVASGPLEVTPEEVRFAVHAQPDGCFAGEVTAAWTLDKLGTATIDQTGTMRVVAPVAGPLTVNAHAGSFIASADVDVQVQVRDDAGVSSDVAERFDGPGSGHDPMTVLYPYQDTVFPLGMQPPVIQWDKNGTNATAVRVALVWPVGGEPEFHWERIVSEPNPGRLEIPLQVWKAFEQTAKGDDAAYVVQRLIGTTLRSEVVRPIRFANAPLRGRIMYTEYGRADHHAYMMGVDPGSTQGAYNLFQGTSGASGCPVCHSVSANGNVFLTSDATWSNTPGVSSVRTDGTLRNLSDYPSVSTYKAGADDWRGFAWAPLTPDGQYALAANNVWGNSRESVVGIDSNRQVSVTSKMVSGGNGVGLLADYYRNTSFTGVSRRRTDAVVDFSWGSGNPGGALPSDNFSVRWSGTVQPYYSERHTFYVISGDGVRLTVNGDVLIDVLSYSGSSRTRSAAIDLQKGVEYDIQLDYIERTGSAAVRLEWESASTPRGVIPQTQLNWDDSGHGVLVTYYDNMNFTTQRLQRVEPQLAADWGSGSPAPSIGADTFSTRWEAMLEPPVDGRYRFCGTANDTISVRLDDSTILSATGSPSNVCSSDIDLLASQRYRLRVDHQENTSAAAVQLEWQATVNGTTVLGREVIPQERLHLPDDYVTPTNGLTATYYDNIDFNATLSTNPSNPRAFRRIQPNVDHDWGNAAHREEYHRLQAATELSARLTGQIIGPCTGMTHFRLVTDDGATLWIGGIRIATRASAGTAEGSIHLTESQAYDLKLDWAQATSSAKLRLEWKPCNAGSWTVVPSSALLPTGDRGDAGFVRAGGDNGSGTDYFVWQVTTQSGVASSDVTSATPGRWGLRGATMMVPAFSPDGSKLTFVDGDQAGGAGWRKGLSVFEFSQTGRFFSERRLIVNNWPMGDVIKWPTFESDSRSVIYSAAPAGSYCCINSWTNYGFMAPTDYYETPGRLMSVDVEAPEPNPVYLQRANSGERAVDANKAWQPTTLPAAAGGYRWVVFTSSRPYGNTINLEGQRDYSDPSNYQPMLNTDRIQSQLWVAALDDAVSGDADRSYPAFWLPNQNYHEDPARGFINERGFWALEACRPTGTGASSECEVDEDCCGAGGDEPVAACKVDLPVTIPVTRHCAPITSSSSCSLPGDGCAGTEDCCPGTLCIDSVCAAPPSFDSFSPGNVARVYQGQCRFDAAPVWRFFDWQASTPETGSFIQFYAETASDPADFRDLPVAPQSVNTPGVVYLGAASGPSDGGWIGNDIGALFDAAGVPQREYVKITMRLSPNEELTESPVLHDFRLSYSCPPTQ